MKKLRQALAACQEAQIQQALRQWSLDGETNTRPQPPGKGYLLLSKVQDPAAARFAWAALSNNERKLLHNIVALDGDGGAPYEVIQKTSGLSAASCASVVKKLEYVLLIQEQEETLNLRFTSGQSYVSSQEAATATQTRVLYPFSESQANLYAVGKELLSSEASLLNWPLARILSSLQSGHLQQIVMKQNLKLDFSHSRQKLATLLAKHLIESGPSLAALPTLDLEARDLFQDLCQRKGIASMKEVRVLTHTSGIALYRLIEVLSYYGLAFTTFKGQEHVLFIPHDLYASFSKSDATPIAAGLIELASPPANSKSAEPIIQNDMAMLIGAVYQQKIEPTQAKKVPKRIAAKLQPRLQSIGRPNYEGGDDYLDILLFSAQQLNLVQLARSPIADIKPYYEPGPQIESWSQQTQARQTQQILQQWLTNYQWKDIVGYHFDQENAYGLQIKPGRAVLIEQLMLCIPERWYTIESLLRCLWENHPLAMQQNTPYMYGSEVSRMQKMQKIYQYWRLTSGEIYIGMLANMLYELGMVALGYTHAEALTEDGADNPDAFQVSMLGADTLALHSGARQENTTSAIQQQALIVQPNFEILLMQPDFALLYRLLPFAQLDQVGMVSHLTLTRASLLRGLEQGCTLEEIIHILQEHGQKDIPQNILYTLHDWAKAYQEVKISQVFLLEVSSEATAAQLCAMRKLQEYTIRQVAPRLLLISSDINLQTLRNLLEKEGIKAQFLGNFHTGRSSQAIY